MKNYAYGLFLFLLASVFVMSFNINHIDMAAADSDGNISKDFGNLSNLDINNIIQLPLPTACVFNDGDNPKIDKCDEISPDQETLGSDNIFFTLNSPRAFDLYTCTLQVQDGPVLSSFECRISSNVAEAQIEDLDDGDYVFTVTAQRTIGDNNPITQDALEEAASPPFNFRVGIGGDGGGFIDVGTFASEKSNFENLLINEKLGFINLEKKLKNNEKTNTTSLACLIGKMFDGDSLTYGEFNCNRLLIFATTSPTSTSNMSEQGSPYSNDMYIYTVNNALSNGINGYLISCGLTENRGFSGEDNMEVIGVNPIPCRDIFIAYEISS
jgi:hypothetical protein